MAKQLVVNQSLCWEQLGTVGQKKKIYPETLESYQGSEDMKDKSPREKRNAVR